MHFSEFLVITATYNFLGGKFGGSFDFKGGFAF